MKGQEDKGKRRKEKGRGGEGPLDLLPSEKFPSYATAFLKCNNLL